jgi:hypothetical protein
MLSFSVSVFTFTKVMPVSSGVNAVKSESGFSFRPQENKRDANAVRSKAGIRIRNR